MFMDITHFSELFTPALIISIIVYLSIFFGKVINDQSPFSDDIKWSVEFKGVLFMISISFGILGVYLAKIIFPIIPNNWFVYIGSLIIISLIIIILQISNSYLSSKFFNSHKNNLEALEKKTDGFIKIFSKSHKYLNSSIISTILLFMGTLEFFTKNIYVMILFYPLIFLSFCYLAYNSSLKKAIKDEIVPVDIYLRNQNNEVLREVIILKYNPDNLRIRKDNKVIILNKDEISKIEMIVPEKYL